MLPTMQEPPTPHDNESNGRLIQPTADEQREAMRQWRRLESGMDGKRGELPEKPDDAVAYKLLDAAGDAMERGHWQQGINILRLVVKDYRQSQEAACARRVIDRLADRHR
jgi:hypothetical protein